MQYDKALLKNMVQDIAKQEIGAVVIKDMHKGAISKQLIESLSKNDKLAKAPWFVSSKAWFPDWFDVLKTVNLKLLLIPQISARRAIRDRVVNSWITHNGKPDKSAYKIIMELNKKVRNQDSESTLFIVLPEGYNLIACNCQQPNDNNYPEYKEIALRNEHYKVEPDDHDAEKDVVVQSVINPSPEMPITGMASIFLPILVVKMFENNYHLDINKLKGNKLRELLEESLLHTFTWAKNETKKITEGINKRVFMSEEDKSKNKNGLNFNFQELMFNTERKKWETATMNIGAIGSCKINDQVHYDIELWRSTIEVNGYVCLDDSRRTEIRRLIDALKEFKSRDRRYHIGCMLVADPGSGKTFLARKLAKLIGLRFLPFNITQMLKTEDILNCFDEIETAQSQDREQPILVFIDEINAKLAQDPAYGAFLAPLEDGIYIKNGKEFHIDPCFWLFSGTKHLVSSNYAEKEKAISLDKKSDFFSRLSMGEIDLTRKSSNKSKVENVYIGVSLIRGEFPDVRFISKEVLKFFYHLPSRVSIRNMKHFVKLFNDIRYNRVLSGNLPDDNMISDQLKSLIYDDEKKIEELLKNKDNKNKEEMVEIHDN